MIVVLILVVYCFVILLNFLAFLLLPVLRLHHLLPAVQVQVVVAVQITAFLIVLLKL